MTDIKIPLHTQKIKAIRTKEQRDDFILWLAAQVEEMPRSIPNMLASDWIEQNIVIVEGDYQGPYSFRLTPYLQEVADRMSIRSLTQEIAIIKANQLGMSMLSFALICYFIYYGIGPQLFISGDATMAEESFEKRLDPMLEASGLRHYIKPIVKKSGGARATGDTKGVKSYKGTHIRAIGPNSEGQLRSMPARIAIVEEIDVFPQNLKNKGNPVEKVVRRTDNYGVNKRIYYNSTPKAKSTSQILPLFEAGTKCEYTWLCPECGYRQPFIWAGFDWDRNDDGAPDVRIDNDGRMTNDPVYYKCQNPAGCSRKIKEHEKYSMLLNRRQGGTAEYVPAKRPDRPGLWSCHVPAFYSATRSWVDIVLNYHRVKDDPITYPDFVNDTWGECWEETQTKPEPGALMRRAEEYEFGTIPAGVAFLTLAADIQGDRIEACLMGWARNAEAWVLNYWVFDGATIEPDAPCWNHLHEIIDCEYARVDGLGLGNPLVTFVDAGYYTSQVNHFCDQYVYDPSGRRIGGVFPIEGRETLAKMYQFCDNEAAVPKVALNDQRLKRAVYNYLMREPTPTGVALPNGYIHFSKSLGKSFYSQLTAEEWVATGKNGKGAYKIDNPKHRRNEALDVVKMNYGALYFIYHRYFEEVNKRRTRKHLREIEADWNTFWDKFDSNKDGEEA
jgi:phage terminase large subunit GpA-like protein